jgi:iron complex outermembrane receptor protein
MAVLNGRLPLAREGTTELYAFGSVSRREGTGSGFRRSGLSERNWPEIHPLGFLPEFVPEVMDVSGAAGLRGVLAGWSYDLSGSSGVNRFEFHLDNTLNVSLGPCVTLDPAACASPPLGPDSVAASGDEIPNQTAFFAGALERRELAAAIDLRRTIHGAGARPVTLALGGGVRREAYRIERGEPASYLQGWHPDRNGDPAPPGSQVFPGFQPKHEADESRTTVGAFVDVEARPSTALLAGAAARLEHSSDFGANLSGKLAVRLQPTRRVTLRGAASTGFRAPALSQSVYASTSTNFDPATGSLRDVAILPVASAGARALGARPLDAESSIGASAGFAVSPTGAVTLTVDGFWIAVRGRILLTSELGGPEIEPILAAAGETQVAAARYFSDALDTRTRGIDMTATYSGAAGAGWLTASAAYHRTRTEVSGPIPTVPGTSVPIFDDGGLNAVTGERPRWRASLTTSYAAGRWTVLARGRLYGPYRSSVWSFTEFQEYGAETVVDAELTRAFPNGLELRLGVRNLLDNFPDRTGPVNSFGIMQWPSASPFGFNGRYVYARLHARLGG